MVADGEGHLQAGTPIRIAAQRMVGVVSDWPAQSGGRIEPTVAVKRVAAVRPHSDPGPGVSRRGEFRNLSAGLCEGAAVDTSRDAGASGK